MQKAVGTIATGPIIAPLLALLNSRTFISAVIAFGVHQLVIHDPSSAAYEGPIQLILLVMWVALAGKFSIEYVADSWTNKPSSSDQAQSDILSELSDALKAAIGAALSTGTTAGAQTTVNVTQTPPAPDTVKGVPITPAEPPRGEDRELAQQ